ncbi:V-type ATP synthase subunit E [Amphibacillus xylanus]|uniref:V-type ATP synthase subunit E n=1 Tax=Amphibacillus xylanus (strain ATCC 51415 / DSM 6626 / JCM 7361 / LMG 17667 / NBRC 15112 / Ep01) TaxID=698758 RepID=K0J6H8_AMPXN|nr:hypothetical protein [Amphibacillus xylanus]BAM46663.1 hypothetical protein AXY_05310 [Amphibacillus xylanus NBRC 15112]
MDGNEKLSLFRDIVFEHTEKSVAEQLESFEASLKKVFHDHQSEKKQKDDLMLATEKDNVRKERNKQVAQLQLKLQRDLHKEQQKLKAEVFNQVNQKLKAFMETDDYVNLLERQIKQALAIAKDEQILIYIDPVDQDKINELERRSNHKLIVSDRPFIGGIRGVIQSRNMLIDYSFLKRLEAERDNFSFDVADEGDNA